MIIKIYNKSFVQITTLFSDSRTADFNDLSYKDQVNNVGDASFTVRINNSKINTTSIKKYNRVEIAENDGEVRWVGVIIDLDIDLNIINVKCYGLAYMLEKRITADGLVCNGQAGTQITNIINTMNGIEDTGILLGTIDLTNSVNLTFNNAKILSAIKSIIDTASGQFILRPDRTLDAQDIVGYDLTNFVIFSFDITKPQMSNLLQFKLTDSGKNIISKTASKSGTLSSAQEDSVIKANFGLLEDFQNFSDANDQTTLDNLTSDHNNSGEISPTIALSPDVDDDFEAGDIVRVILNNGFINVDTAYQVLEKSVKIVNAQKLITVKLNADSDDFVKDFRKIKENLELLNRSV